MEKIIVTIDLDGSITVEADGYSGPACDKTLREFADSLGTVEEVHKKPEFFVAAKVAVKRTA